MKHWLNPLALHYTLRLTITCTLVVALYQLFHLHNGYWAAFSVLGCIFPTTGQAFRRIKQRILGTLIGMLLGILIAHAAGNHWLYLDGLIPLLVFLTVYLKAWNYTFYALFNTLISVALVCLITPGDWSIALTRMEMTLLGCGFALLATYTLFPHRASDTLREQLQQLHAALRDYYFSIIQQQPHAPTPHNVFATLQQAQASLQETTHEHPWRKPSPTPHQAEYERLTQLYQTLLLLECERPARLEHPDLKPLNAQLEQLLERIGQCFTDPSKIPATQAAVAELLATVTQLRSHSAQDSTIPVATFHEHIQLTETLRQLGRVLSVSALDRRQII